MASCLTWCQTTAVVNGARLSPYCRCCHVVICWKQSATVRTCC